MLAAKRFYAASRLGAICFLAVPAALSAQSSIPNTGLPQIVSTGQRITPLAPAGASFEPLNPGLAYNPSYTVGQAVSTTLSPDGKTLLLLTSGYNLFNYTSGPQIGTPLSTDSTEWIFVFDVSTGKARQKQAIPVTNSYCGIV